MRLAGGGGGRVAAAVKYDCNAARYDTLAKYTVPEWWDYAPQVYGAGSGWYATPMGVVGSGGGSGRVFEHSEWNAKNGFISAPFSTGSTVHFDPRVLRPGKHERSVLSLLRQSRQVCPKEIEKPAEPQNVPPTVRVAKEGTNRPRIPGLHLS